jgi:hypothetical protein
MRALGLICFVAVAIFARTAQALIIYESGSSTDDTYNTTAPSDGSPWNYVAEVGTDNASAVYLGNDYLITANHVGLSGPITLDGTTFSIDNSFAAVQVGSSDLKIFKITGDPGLTALALASSTDVVTNQAATMIGWGEGKGSIITSSGSNVGWNWAGGTYAERWGTNLTLSTLALGDSSILLQTAFNPSLGPNAAAGSLGDSGSGLFEFLDGQWKLAGITVGVDTSGASYYADSPQTDNPDNTSGMDYTYEVDINQYLPQINAIVAVPEPGSLSLWCAGLPLLWIYRRVRRA